MRDFWVFITVTFFILLVAIIDALPTWMLFLVVMLVGVPLIILSFRQGIDTTPGRDHVPVDYTFKRNRRIHVPPRITDYIESTCTTCIGNADDTGHCTVDGGICTRCKDDQF